MFVFKLIISNKALNRRFPFLLLTISRFYEKMAIRSGCAESQPLVTFGVVTDVQYADCDDRPASYDFNKTRFYRKALNHVEKAFNSWETASQPVNFVLQLGDIIDGLNVSLKDSHRAFQKTLEKFESHHSIPTFHTVGNHELYNFKRHELASYFYRSIEKMNIPQEVFTVQHPVTNENNPSIILYYKFCPNPLWKFISLDCFDVSVLGHNVQTPAYQEASNILEFYHKHNIYELWDSNGPLEGLDVRFQQMNGALGTEQLRWLEEELQDSDKKGQRVVVFGHVSLAPESADYSCLLWNYEEVMDCFHRHHCVVAYFSGHAHVKGYTLDTHGIHYVVFTGIIETPPEEAAFATISLYSDKMEIEGHGREENYTLKFPTLAHSSLGESNTSDNESIICRSTISVKIQV